MYFVGRAQLRIDQATLENEIVEGITLTEEGIGSGQVPFLLAERAHSESARSMCAVKTSPATPCQEKILSCSRESPHHLRCR